MESPRTRPLLLLVLAGAGLHFAWFAAASARPWDADSLVRSMYIQRALEDPRILVDPWARPLGILPYLPAGLLPLGPREGFAAVKALSALFSLLACLAVGLAVRARAAGRPWAGAAALATVPVFVEMSAGVTPETACVAAFALALWCRARGRTGLETLFLALLPLARFEMVVLFPLAGAELLFRARRPLLLAVLGLPTLAWYGAVAWLRSDPLWIATYGSEMASWNPYALDRNMIWRSDVMVDPLHYFFLAPAIFGLPVLFLALVRLTRAWDMTVLQLAAIVLFHALMKGRAGHAGYPRYILPAAPLLALFAAEGLEILLAGLSARGSRALQAGALLALCGTCLLLCRPLGPEEPEDTLRREAAAFLLEHDPAAPHLTSQPWIDLYLGRNWCDHPRLTWANLEAAPAGTWVLWDPTSARTDHQVALDALQRHPGFAELARFPQSLAGQEFNRAGNPLDLPREDYQVVLFRKE